MNRTLIVFGIFVCLVSLSCVETVDIEAEQTALLETDKAWAETASTSNDVEQIVSFWSDDAKVIPPGGPVIEGKAALRDYISQSLQIPQFSVSWEPSEVTVSPTGNLGYTIGNNKFTFADENGELVTKHGRYVTVWRKESDGQWKCVIDIWNE